VHPLNRAIIQPKRSCQELYNLAQYLPKKNFSNQL